MQDRFLRLVQVIVSTAMLAPGHPWLGLLRKLPVRYVAWVLTPEQVHPLASLV